MNNTIADPVEITYYTDPLCCWSWAMEPQWRRLRFEYEGKIKWRYCMGGLLPSWKNYSDPVHMINRPVQMGPLWMEAAHLSGMPLKNKIWVDNPPSSSYLSCIAVKCAGKQSAVAEEKYLRLLREAVMVHSLNISTQSVLVNLAQQVADQFPTHFDAAAFEQDLKSNACLESFRADLDEVILKNIKRFPSLVFRRTGHDPLILSGYRPYAVLLNIMKQIAPDFTTTRPINIEEYRNYWGNMMEREEKEVVL